MFETHRGKRLSTVVGKERTPAQVTSDLKEALAHDGGTIVVCDLRGMTVPGATVPGIFGPVSAYLNHWPGAAIVVHAEDDSILTRLPDGAQQRLLARADRSAAVTEVESMLPPVQQARVRLPADPSAARQARMFATQALEEWQVPELAGTATLVVSELVTNSIRHAQTINELTISLAQERLRIAVRDLAEGSPTPIRELDADALDGRGLLLVEVMSLTWGVFPSTVSGKTVWAILDGVPAQGEPTEGEQTLST